MTRASYDLLGVISFFTVGRGRGARLDDPPRHQGPRGRRAPSTPTSSAASSAPRSSHCDDLIRLKTMAACRDAGLLRLEGKEYVMKDGDVTHFRFNV